MEETSKYKKEKLIQNSQSIFGESRYLVAGALVGSKEEITMKEAKKRINSFKKRKVNK